MATNNPKYRLRFFFDYGAGGCLWGDNDKVFEDFGVGPLDLAIKEKIAIPSDDAMKEIGFIDKMHSTYLNKDYPVDPSYWTKADCDFFNSRVDKLIIQLRKELGDQFEINDKQERYSQDPDLKRYLDNPKNFKRSV